MTPQSNDSQRFGATTVEPLVEELAAAPSPVDAFRRFASLPWTLFLDSAATDDTHGRFSYLAACPVRTLVARGRSVTISDTATSDLENREYHARSTTETDPFDALDGELRRWSARVVPGVPPFQGGAAGLLGYGLCHVVERIAAARHDEFRVPDLVVGLYDWVLAWDHVKSTCHLISLGIPATDADERTELAARRAHQVKERLARPVDNGGRLTRASDGIPASRLAPSWEVPGESELLSNFSKDDYIRAVARSIEYIHAGDVFQVNLSQRLLSPLRRSVVDFYLTLRKANPAPFAGYFDTGEHVVASSSPEQFLSLDGDDVITRPIKGTRSRGYTAEEDVYRRLDLRESEKDRSENVMIVDLLRNDLSRVCRPHTVRVPRLFELERHPTVHHLVSEVRGKLREGVGAVDLVRASFPGGSITGAPKVRAMEIISKLEPTARGNAAQKPVPRS